MMPIAGATRRRLGLGGIVLLAALPAAAGEGTDKDLGTIAGSFTYKTYCAVCHGAGGKGDGPLSENLRFRPLDLTLIARRNGGSYPEETVFRIIDGRKPVKGHGGPDMPVWGDAFKNAESGFREDAVKERIQGLVDFLKTIQAPAK